MKQPNRHIAIYISGDTNKEEIIQQVRNNKLLNDYILLNNLEGELYSVLRLKELMDEEIRHEHIEIKTESSLAALSEGEQKKALLQYIIAKKTDYIIVDNVLDSLDKVSQASIQSTLIAISADTLIIQVVNRYKDILPFIQQLFSIEKNELLFHENKEAYIKQLAAKDSFKLQGTIPAPIHRYDFADGPLVQFNHVSVHYNERPIVHNINWKINRGEFWQLIGPNGSGKSTLLSMITGDNPKAYGQDITLFGRKKGTGETVWSIKEKIGYFTNSMVHLFSGQDSIEHMIISGFVDSVGLYIVPTDMQIQLAHKWLSLIGLENVKHKSFRHFSLGLQRLILIVRAMVKHPPLLILDEPTSGVDDYHVSMITAFINKIAAESTTAILYVSHRQEENLIPTLVFELMPGKEGSVGQVL